jgi:hypothetical protein
LESTSISEFISNGLKNRDSQLRVLGMHIHYNQKKELLGRSVKNDPESEKIHY